MPHFAVSSSAITFWIPTWTNGFSDSLVRSLDGWYKSILVIVFSQKDGLTYYFQLRGYVGMFVGAALQYILVKLNPLNTFSYGGWQ